MKSILTFFFLLLLINVSMAQIKVGLPAGNADPSAILDASNKGSVNKGFLPPQVALTSTIVWGLAGSTPINSMIVYNTATAGTGTSTAVTPGMYYWYISQWITFAQAASASVATGTFSCANNTTTITPATNGFTVGQAYTGTVTAPYTAATNGSYPSDTVIINGITLGHPSGVISAATGSIVYNITGTYTGTAGQYLNFGITLPGTFICQVGLPLAATYSSSSLACGGALAGSLSVGVAATSANTKTVTITPATAGSYTISSNTVGGISYSGSGGFTSGQVGSAQSVIMTATGIPTTAGNNSFTVTASGQTCTFIAAVATAATFNCSGATKLQSPTGSLTNNSTYTGSYTIAYTAGNGTSYAASTQILTGLTLTRVAGSYAAGGGNVVYNLSGTFTGASPGLVSFTIPECSGTASFGYDAIYASLSTNATNYVNAPSGSWIKVTAAEYANAQTVVTSTYTRGQSDLSSLTVSNSQGNPFIIPSTGNFYTLPANNYLYGFSFRTAGNQSNTSSTANAILIAQSTSQSGAVATGFNPGTPIPAINPLSASSIYYFLFKGQSTTYATPIYLGFFMEDLALIGYGGSAGNPTDLATATVTGTPPNQTTSGAAFTSTNFNITMAVQFLGTATRQW